MNRMIKRFMTLAVAATVGISAFAAERYYEFVVWMNDGASVSFPLSERPKVAHADGVITVTTTQTEVEYQRKQVHKFTIAETEVSDETAISGTEIADGPEMNRQGDAIAFSACKAGETVSVFDTAGRQIRTYKVGDDGGLIISLSDFGRGIYVVKMKSLSCKFIKK